MDPKIKRKKYFLCDNCNFGSLERDTVMQHEMICPDIPVNRSCGTCKSGNFKSTSDNGLRAYNCKKNRTTLALAHSLEKFNKQVVLQCPFYEQ